MSDTKSLTDAVAAIGDAATAKENSDQIDQKVAKAQTLISNLNSDLEELADDVSNLQFYREVLARAFDVSPPGRQAIETAQSAVQRDKQELVQILLDGGLEVAVDDDDHGATGVSGGPKFDAYWAEIEEAQKSISAAIDTTKNQLRARRDTWEEQLESAEELQAIIGGQNDEFADIVSWIKQILRVNMFSPEKSASSVVQEWERAREKWEASEGLHGLEAFKKKHGLSDKTIQAIRRLSSSSGVTLAQLDEETLRQLQSVPELSKSVTLSI